MTSPAPHRCPENCQHFLSDCTPPMLNNSGIHAASGMHSMPSQKTLLVSVMCGAEKAGPHCCGGARYPPGVPGREATAAVPARQHIFSPFKRLTMCLQAMFCHFSRQGHSTSRASHSWWLCCCYRHGGPPDNILPEEECHGQCRSPEAGQWWVWHTLPTTKSCVH